MKLRRLFSVAALAVSLSVSTGAFAQHQRTIFFNGKVFTANPNQLWAKGLVMEGKVITVVGSTEEVLRAAESDSTLIDLKGLPLIPGFNDAHVHPFDSTSFPRAVALNSASDFVPGPGPTLDEVIQLVRRGAAEAPPGTWLFVNIGAAIIENPAANRFALDAASPDHPVLLASWFGHGTYFNTRGMHAIGLAEDEPDPFGGFYERLPGTRIVNGVAHEYAEHRIRAYFASQMTDQELQRLYEVFAAGAARMGYTSVQAMSIGIGQQRHVDVLARSRIPIKWRAICFPLTLRESCDARPSLVPDRSPLIVNSGIKWIADATMIERGALLTEDYADAPGVRGRLNFPPSAIAAELERSLTGEIERTQPLFHTVGDGTSDTVLDTMDLLASDAVWRARRPRIEHGTLLRPARYESARRKGVFVVQNPLHFSLAPIVQARFSPALLADVDPMKSLLKAGVKVALGSDSVGSPGNPYLDLFFARVQPTRPAEALTVEEAVIAYTKTAAEAEFQDHLKGTLQPGKRADLVVLSQDIFTLPPPAIPGTRTLLTVVDGEIVFDAGAIGRQP